MNRPRHRPSMNGTERFMSELAIIFIALIVCLWLGSVAGC